MSERIISSKGSELLRAPADCLLSESSNGDYSNVVTSDSKSHLVTYLLCQIEDALIDQFGDNGKINSAIVLVEDPKKRGHSKKDYCGIIEGKITIGIATNSTLFEAVTETGGYFFRQNPLVYNGELGEKEPNVKSICKSICQMGEEIIVVMTPESESFHNFSQDLIDFCISNAVYLVGSVSYGSFSDKFDHLGVIYDKPRGCQKYDNHIQWVITPE